MAAVLFVVVAAVLAGCGGSAVPQAEGSATPDSQPTEGGATLAALWPLTGLAATGPTPRYPVLVVKVDNTHASEPQIGLSKADLIVEELVEGGITRLAAMYYSKLPPVVGPVRSMRASDIGVVKPTHAVLVASGAAPPTYNRLRAAKVNYFDEGGPGYYRDYGRTAPYNLFVKLPELARSVAKKAVVPASYLPWGTEDGFAGVGRARSISVRFSSSTTTQFQYDKRSKTYRNTNTHAAANDQFRPDTVLVLRVREGDAGYLDPAGNHVPETLFSGTGQLIMFHHGMLVRGTWKKKSRDSALQLRTAAGDLTVPAGHVWIELLPNAGDGGGISWKR